MLELLDQLTEKGSLTTFQVHGTPFSLLVSFLATILLIKNSHVGYYIVDTEKFLSLVRILSSQCAPITILIGPEENEAAV